MCGKLHKMHITFLNFLINLLFVIQHDILLMYHKIDYKSQQSILIVCIE